MKPFAMRVSPVWSADGGGGGDGATALAAAAAAAADKTAADKAVADKAVADKAVADKAAADKAASTPYHPEGLPEALRGANDRETLDKIAKDFTGRPKPPDKPDGYQLSFSEEFTKRYGDLKDDKVMPMWREVAHELGLSQEQFARAADKLHERMTKAGLIDDPVNVAAELGKLEPAAGDPKQKNAAAVQRVNTAVGWVTGLVGRNVLTKEEAAQLAQVAETAAGVTVLEKLMKRLGEHGLQGGGNGEAGATDTTEHERRMRAMFPSMNARS